MSDSFVNLLQLIFFIKYRGAQYTGISYLLSGVENLVMKMLTARLQSGRFFIPFVDLFLFILSIILFILAQNNVLKFFRRSSLIVMAIAGLLLFLTSRYIITAWLIKEGFNKQILDIAALVFQIL